MQLKNRGFNMNYLVSLSMNYNHKYKKQITSKQVSLDLILLIRVLNFRCKTLDHFHYLQWILH